MSPMSPAESFRCGEHDARLEAHEDRLSGLEVSAADRERRLTTIEAEWRSRMRLVASYVTPVLLVIAAELIRLFVFKR